MCEYHDGGKQGLGNNSLDILFRFTLFFSSAARSCLLLLWQLKYPLIYFSFSTLEACTGTEDIQIKLVYNVTLLFLIYGLVLLSDEWSELDLKCIFHSDNSF